MDPAALGVIGALAGVIVGGGFESLRSILSFRRDKRWSDTQEQRRRLESVYEALEQVRESDIETTGAVILSLYKPSGRTGRKPAAKAPVARLRLLVHLYWPKFVSSLETVEKARDTLGELYLIALGTREKDDSLEQAERSRKTLGKQSRAFTNAVDAMSDTIVQTSREVEKTLAQLAGKKPSLIFSSPVARVVAVSIFVALLVSGAMAFPLFERRTLRTTEERGNAIVAAIERYRTRVGRFPDSLSAVRPYELQSIPTPTWGDKRWRYQLFAGDASTSSKGPLFELRVCTNDSCYPVLYFNSSVRRWVFIENSGSSPLSNGFRPELSAASR
jgi:hypothetical protein